jgi:hypothetical protein
MRCRLLSESGTRLERASRISAETQAVKKYPAKPVKVVGRLCEQSMLAAAASRQE